MNRTEIFIYCKAQRFNIRNWTEFFLELLVTFGYTAVCKYLDILRIFYSNNA